MLPAVWKVAKFSAWLMFLVGTFLIVRNSVIDFGPAGEGVFIDQRPSMHGRPLWLLCLRLHVVSGIVCLLSCLPQYSKPLLRRIPSLHRNCGKIYAVSVLCVLCPTGIYLAVFANGGITGKTGFVLLGVATFYTTLRGIALISGPQRDREGHQRWITRSFALVSSAISFRIYHTIFFYAGLPEDLNYPASLWLSILGNVAIAELLLRQPARLPHPMISNPDPTIS